MQHQNVFECSNLSIGYSQPLAQNVDFTFKPGEIVLIQGANGAGKSTLIKTILGKISPLAGSYQWLVDKNSISYLPQITNPISHFSFTVEEIINLYDLPDKSRERVPKELLKKKWINTSGGEKQKIMLLSRISNETRVLILDEPFNHLDMQSVTSLSDFLIELVTSQEKLSIVLVSHQEVKLPHNLLNKITLLQ